MPHASGTLNSKTEGFITWAKANLHPIRTLDVNAPFDDLRPLGKMIGDASVVSLSEPAHYSLEPLQFRNRVVRYLIEECGFTGVALESGLVEGRLLYDYVRGAHDDFAAAVSDGLSWTFDRLVENEDLVRWMRHYNDGKPKEQMVHLYGMDVPGSPANTYANRGVDTALVEALHFVARVEPTEAAPLIQRCMPILELLTGEVLKAGNGTGYLQLPKELQDRLTGAINDLISLLERREAAYRTASSAEDYSWAHRAAIGARQVDMCLRCIPHEALDADSDELSQLFLESRQARDRAQADNTMWIVDREGAGRKLIVFAHRYHLSTEPVADVVAGANQRAAAVAGTYLKDRLGDRLLSIGSLFGHGQSGEVGDCLTLDPASLDSLDGIAGETHVSHYLVDIRRAPAVVQEWLHRPHRLAFGPWSHQLASGRAFDVYHYISAIGCVTPRPRVSNQRDTNRKLRQSLRTTFHVSASEQRENEP